MTNLPLSGVSGPIRERLRRRQSFAGLKKRGDRRTVVIGLVASLRNTYVGVTAICVTHASARISPFTRRCLARRFQTRTRPVKRRSRLRCRFPKQADAAAARFASTPVSSCSSSAVSPLASLGNAALPPLSRPRGVGRGTATTGGAPVANTSTGRGADDMTNQKTKEERQNIAAIVNEVADEADLIDGILPLVERAGHISL